MKNIGVVTVARSDYGIYQPVLRAISSCPEFRIWIFAAGMHLEGRFGMTVKMIEDDGYEIRERIPMNIISDDPAGISRSMGAGVGGFAAALHRSRPDLLMFLGDRFDMVTAALAAVPFRIPAVHLHGGEVTEGAIDDLFRHAITKLSHLHFASTDRYARRIIQMGEEPWRVMVSGAPALDNITALRRMSREELATKIGMPFTSSPLLVTYHPATLQNEVPAQQVAEVSSALESWRGPVVFTGVNGDPGNQAIREAIEMFVSRRADARFVENLGVAAYFSLMAVAAAMVGNSSSGIIEAPSFGLPVVNIGPRQLGRVRAANVIDVACSRSDISAAIARATSKDFRAGLSGLRNPYGDGNASSRIVARLREVELNERLLMKKFHDLEEAA